MEIEQPEHRAFPFQVRLCSLLLHHQWQFYQLENVLKMLESVHILKMLENVLKKLENETVLQKKL